MRGSCQFCSIFRMCVVPTSVFFSIFRMCVVPVTVTCVNNTSSEVQAQIDTGQITNRSILVPLFIFFKQQFVSDLTFVNVTNMSELQ